MQARGFSLIEMTVVLCIVSVLLALAIPRFSDQLRRGQGESQTRMLYAELLRARASAVYQRRTTRVKLYRNRFEVYSSQLDNAAGAAPLQSKILPYPVTCNGSGDGVAGYPIDFDPKGLATRWCSICLEGEGGSGAVDSVKISASRVSIGKKDKGDECRAENITVR